jgi:hypothetical protein
VRILVNRIDRVVTRTDHILHKGGVFDQSAHMRVVQLFLLLQGLELPLVIALAQQHQLPNEVLVFVGSVLPQSDVGVPEVLHRREADV